MYFEIYKDARNEFRWRLKAGNHQIIATGGEGYSSKQACQKGIEAVKKITSDTEVREISTEPKV
ncbi:YegP family protein [Seminibacterium arietis]|uniref:YegP family protein n=1 Tax=Seminibacterium arietis TaxID=1173502 RepID=A0ABW3I6L2_9PAST